MKSQLNARQQRFCQLYSIDLNGKQAAIKAGYSKKTAEVTASQLLSNPKVKAHVRSLLEKKTKKLEITAERVLRELATVGFANTSDFAQVKEVTEKVGNRSVKVRRVVAELTKDIEPEKLPALSELKQTEAGIAIKLHDKTKALEMLARHLGLFEKDNDQAKGTVVVNIV